MSGENLDYVIFNILIISIAQNIRPTTSHCSVSPIAFLLLLCTSIALQSEVLEVSFDVACFFLIIIIQCLWILSVHLVAENKLIIISSEYSA